MSASVVFDNGATYGGAYLPASPDLPCRIDGESEKTWFLAAADIEAMARAFTATVQPGVPQFIRAQVSLGGRAKPVKSKSKLRVG